MTRKETVQLDSRNYVNVILNGSDKKFTVEVYECSKKESGNGDFVCKRTNMREYKDLKSAEEFFASLVETYRE